VNIQLRDSASLERTVEVTEAVEKIALETPKSGRWRLPSEVTLAQIRFVSCAKVGSGAFLRHQTKR